MLMCNDIPECGEDAFKNCKEFHMGSKFVEGEPQENSIVKEYKLDDSIRDEYVHTDRAVKAFTKVLFEHYSDTKPEEPQQIKEAIQDNLEKSDFVQFKEIYNFTNSDKDFITVQKFNYILEESNDQTGKTTSVRKARKWLKKMGIVVSPYSFKRLGPEQKQTKVYLGIKEISEYNEFNDYENVVNDLDQGI